MKPPCPGNAAPAPLNRRAFLHQSLAAAALTMSPRTLLQGASPIAPSERITVAGIGLGGQGLQNIAALLQFPEVQVVAVCDVNRESHGYISWNWSQGKEQQPGGREPGRRLVEEYYASQRRTGQFHGCKMYSDYRELLEKEDVDAVMIATPDHSHAVITMAALKRRKHVYCEKPLAYSVAEARLVAEAAREAGVATQLGNHGQASEEDRITREFIAAGAIGPVHEVRVTGGGRFWKSPAGEGRPTETPPVPAGLDWDLWLGPAPLRPYHPEYCPWNWRNWWDFGTGLLGDLGCHKLSTVFKALNLGHPTTIEASSTKLNPETYPLGVIARFEFPARDGLPPVLLTWHDGGLKPHRPPELDPGQGMGDVLYLGETGTLMGTRLIPEAKQKAYGRPPKTLARSVGHYKEWVDACRGGPPAGSNFVDHAGLLSEVCLLGNVAVRTQAKLLWDGPNLKFTNHAAANGLLRRAYRAGWTL